jgi:hypothetical protein
MFVVVLFIVPIGILFITLSLWGLFERQSSESLQDLVTVR